MRSTGLEVLKTLYDHVEERQQGKYLVEQSKKFGLCVDDIGVVAEPIYNTGVVREHYSLFFTSAYTSSRDRVPSKPNGAEADKAIAIFHCNMEQIEISAIDEFVEHSGSGFSILEVYHRSPTDLQVDLYEAPTGKKICSYTYSTQCKLRLNQYIILGYTEKNKDGKDKFIGLTKDFKIGRIVDLLKEKYPDITYNTKLHRYIGTDENGREIKFNQLGQLY